MNVWDVDILPSGGTNCGYTLTGEHPDNGSNFYKVETIDDSINAQISVRAIITEQCGADPPTEYSNEIVTWQHPWGGLYYSNGSVNRIPVGGTINFIKVHRDNGSGVISSLIIPLEPVGVISAGYDTGCAGTVNTSDLVFSGGFAGAAAMETAVIQVIQNALCAQWGAIDGTDYISDIDIVLQGTSVRFNIEFAIKHSPNTQWIGIDKNDLDIEWTTTGGAIRTEADLDDIFQHTPASQSYSKDLPCNLTVGGSFFLENTAANHLYIDAGTNFNVAQPNTNITISIASEGGSVITGQCTIEDLIAIVCEPLGFNCSNPSYLWTFPDGDAATTQTITPTTVGNYSVAVTCTNVACTMTATYTVT